jgi:hypothetical protein
LATGAVRRDRQINRSLRAATRVDPTFAEAWLNLGDFEYFAAL